MVTINPQNTRLHYAGMIAPGSGGDVVIADDLTTLHVQRSRYGDLTLKILLIVIYPNRYPVGWNDHLVIHREPNKFRLTTLGM
jgi:hypothetical protein